MRNNNKKILKDKLPAKKKSLGQHFLRKQSVVDNMIHRVTITPDTSIMEIGCGDGFLTQAILSQSNCKELLCYEIDPEWATFVRDKLSDPRLTIKLENILDVELPDKKWTLLANLPYQITFPILFKLQKNKLLFTEGVIMMQEEVGQKLVAKRGRSYSATSIFLQYNFELELMDKVEPVAFSPPPKVHSRLVYFKPKFDQPEMDEQFWKFIKVAFKQPRRTLNNNFRSAHYDLSSVPNEMLLKRAQELSLEQFLEIWSKISLAG